LIDYNGYGGVDMSFLYDYIKNIALFMIFSAFAEIIIPNGKYRVYAKTVIGFLLIIIVIRPVFGFFDENGFQTVFGSVSNEFNKTIMEKEEDFYDDKQKKILRKNFSDNLAEQAEKVLQNICVVLEAKFVLRDDGFDIEKAEFVVKPKESDKNFFRIEKFKSEEEISSEFVQNLKKVISDFYNLSFDNIHIIVRKN